MRASRALLGQVVDEETVAAESCTPDRSRRPPPTAPNHACVAQAGVRIASVEASGNVAHHRPGAL
jgi:hypothetical protein